MLSKRNTYLAKQEEYSKKIRELGPLSSDAFETYCSSLNMHISFPAFEYGELFFAVISFIVYLDRFSCVRSHKHSDINPTASDCDDHKFCLNGEIVR